MQTHGVEHHLLHKGLIEALGEQIDAEMSETTRNLKNRNDSFFGRKGDIYIQMPSTINTSNFYWRNNSRVTNSST